MKHTLPQECTATSSTTLVVPASVPSKDPDANKCVPGVLDMKTSPFMPRVEAQAWDPAANDSGAPFSPSPTPKQKRKEKQVLVAVQDEPHNLDVREIYALDYAESSSAHT